ncbi:MAG: V-type ATPase 116kDa subunit family protein [Candidatus Njordarchaeales archaeon]
MIIKTKKVTILAIKEVIDQLLAELGRHGIIEIKKPDEKEFIGFRKQIIEERTFYPELIDKLKSLIDKYAIKERIQKEIEIKLEKKISIKEAREIIEHYERAFENLAVHWMGKEFETDKLLEDYMERYNKLREEFTEKALPLLQKLKKSYKLAIMEERMLITEHLALLQGWVPEKEIPKLRKIIKDFKERINRAVAMFIEEEREEEDEESPVLYKTSSITEGFAGLIRQYGTPGPHDKEPTIIAGLLWSFMFGFMFADYGEGLVLLLIGIYGVISNKEVMGMSFRKLGKLLISAGIFAIIFGLLVGEFFLIEVHPLFPGLEEGWLEHSYNVVWLLKIAVFIGAIEILLGMIINMLKALKHGEMIEAIMGEHGAAGIVGFVSFIILAFIILGGITIIPSKIELFGITIIPGRIRIDQHTLGPYWFLPIIGLLISVISMMLSSSLMGEGIEQGLGIAIEALISFMSNTLSYTRLAGFAIAHASYGLVAATMLEKNVVIGTVIGLVFLNAFALSLEVVIVMIQALRLTFYEFMTKFYEGTGKLFKPFKI